MFTRLDVLRGVPGGCGNDQQVENDLEMICVGCGERLECNVML